MIFLCCCGLERKGSNLTAPFIQGTQNNNKCPHGFPIGACPICSGMGGGGKTDRNTPRRAGEMTYNECMAAWIKMQAAQEAKTQAKIDRFENAQKSLLQNRIMQGLDKVQKNLDKFMQNIESMPQIIKAPIKFVVNVIIQPVMNLIAKLPAAINNIQMFFNNVAQYINSVSEKLASVFGEVKNFIQASFVQNTKKALKTILSLFTEEQEESEEDEEKKKIKARELKKVIKGLFRIRSKAKEEEKEDEYQPY